MSGLRQIFEAVVELPPAERRAQLDALALGRDELRQLHAMLEADDRGSLLDVALSETVERLRDESDPGTRLIDSTVGNFVLEELIGEGGSALVFRARRAAGSGSQVVALKLLHATLYSPRAERRFQREQAILASLSHPNIARLVEGGVSDRGQPYLAMELVDGLPLTVHADEHRLDLDQRLALFETLCLTVDAAHAALIIHRDLKPSNVLVSRSGELKVLDFGIARPQDEDAGPGATATVSLTPEYAAPEQFRAGHATVAVDIFALGVILAELLTGQRVREGRPSNAALRGAGSDRPGIGTPREVARRLRGDLDAIVLRACDEEPARRYRSARDLAQDVRRHLRREPVQARRGSGGYVVQRFVRRNWIAVSVSVLFLLALLASLGLAYRQASRAEQSATQARAQATRADATLDFMIELMGEADPSTPRSHEITLKEALRRSVDRINDDATLDRRTRITLLAGLAQTLAQTGEGAEAVRILRTTHASALEQLGPDDALTFDVVERLIRYENEEGNSAVARELVDELLRRVPRSDQGRRVRALRLSSSVAWHQRERERALTDSRESLRLSRAIGDVAEIRRSLASLGAVLLNAGEAEEAARVFEERLAMDRAEHGEDNEQTALAYSGLSRALRRLGRLEDAERAARAAIAIDRRVYPNGHWILANHLNALTLILIERRSFDEALRSGEEGLALSRRWLAEDNPERFFAINQVGSVLLGMERFEEAGSYFEETLRERERVLGTSHFDTAVTRSSYGYVLGMTGDTERALAELARAVAAIDAVPGADIELFGRAIERHALIALRARKLDAAAASVERLASLAPRFAPTRAAWWRSRTASLKAQVHAALGRRAEAIASLQAGLAGLVGDGPPDRVLRTELLVWLASQRIESGDRDAAGTALREAGELLARTPSPPRSLLQLQAQVSARL